MEKNKVAVLFGGQSSEYSVSLHSVASVLHNFPSKYEVIMIGITSDGHWYLYKGDIDSIEHDHWLEKEVYPCTLSLNPSDHGFIVEKDGNLEKLKVDVIFPVLHGPHGEDGTVQAACELAGIPCVGCKMTSSAICMDKEYTHIVVERKGIKMAKWLCIRDYEKPNLDDLYQKVEKELKIPCIIKPCNAGSSYGVSKAKDLDSFKEGIKDAFKYDNKIIIEEFMTGFEVGCAVLGNHELVLGEPDEIEISTDIFDFTEKYNLITSKIHCPARINEDIRAKVHEVASIVYRCLDCVGMARVDCFVNDGEVYLNEINTIPGFTSASRYPTMMAKVGYPFQEVIDLLIQHTME